MEKESLLSNKKFILFLSVFLSLFLWLFIAIAVNPVSESVVSGVGVNISTSSGIISDLGLTVIEGGEATVDVVVSGSRAVIGGISPADISVTASLSGVSGAGTYNLTLSARNNGSKSFDIISVNPSSIPVKFDKLVSKTVQVGYQINGEYDIPDEYMQMDVYTDPSEITVTGPEKDVENIAGALLSINLEGTFNTTQRILSDIELVDAAGNVVEYNEKEITLSESQANVVVPIHEVKELPVYFEYTNVPLLFDASQIPYRMSQDYITVDADESVLAKYSNLLLGYIDLSKLYPDNSSYSFPVSLPDGLESMDENSVVNVEFDMDGFVEQTFYVNKIILVNAPAEYKVSTTTTRLAVMLVGPESVMEDISAEDIVVSVDLSTREITQTGQYKIKASIVLPNGQFAWAIGSYTIPVTVKDA